MKRVLACLLALSLTLIFVACGGNGDETTTTATTTAADTTTDPNAPTTTTDPNAPTTTTDPNAPTTTTDPNAPTTTTDPNAPTTPLPPAPKEPSTPAEILAYYNNATALVSNSKAGMKRVTKTALKDDSIKGTDTLSKMAISGLLNFKFGDESVRTIIGNFLGEGTKDASNKKGEKPLLYKSNVGTGDVVGAPAIRTEGDNYIITFILKGENNPQKGSSAIGRVTDNYVTGEEALNEIKNADTGGIAVEVSKIDMVTSNVKVEATINKTTGRVVKVVHDNTFDATITTIKVSVIKLNGAVGQGTINAVYSDFVW